MNEGLNENFEDPDGLTPEQRAEVDKFYSTDESGQNTNVAEVAGQKPSREKLDPNSPSFVADIIAESTREAREATEKGGSKSVEAVRRECQEEEVLQLKNFFDQFEAACDLNQLYAITTVTAETEGPRDAAKKALIPIVWAWNKLRSETDVQERAYYQELADRFQYITRAVGIKSSGIIDHTR